MIRDPIKKNISSNWVFIVLFLVLLAYLVARVFLIDITIDEIYTVENFVKGGLEKIFEYQDGAIANNHMLLSLILLVLTNLFGFSIFVVKIPSLVAFIVYFWSCVFISKKLAGGDKRLVYLISFLLILNPYILDFFVLARGYSLALAFMMLSILLLLINNEKVRILSLLVAVLSVLANFTYLYFFLAVLVINLTIAIGGFIVKKNRFSDLLTHVSTNLLIAFLLGMSIVFPITRLVNREQLYYGGSTSFYDDTLGTLVSKYVSVVNIGATEASSIAIAMLIFGLILTVVTLFYVFRSVVKTGISSLVSNKELVTRLIVFSIPILVFLANNIHIGLGDSKYLINRTAAIYLPLIILFVSSSAIIILNFYKDRLPGKRIYTSIVLIILVLVALNFISTINFTYTKEFPRWANFTAITKEILDYKESTGASDIRIYYKGSGSSSPYVLGYFIKNSEFPQSTKENIEVVAYEEFEEKKCEKDSEKIACVVLLATETDESLAGHNLVETLYEANVADQRYQKVIAIN